MRRRILFVLTDRSYLSKVLRHIIVTSVTLDVLGGLYWPEIKWGVSILIVIRPSQDILDFKAWGDHIE